MTIRNIMRAAAPLLLAAVAIAQGPIYIPPGGTDAGTDGNDDFIVDHSSHCVAYLNGGSDFARVLADGLFGAQVDVNDCEPNDVVDALNGGWDLIMADYGDIVLCDPLDTVIIENCETGETELYFGWEYYEAFEEELWEWLEEFYDDNGVYPWDYSPYDYVDAAND